MTKDMAGVTEVKNEKQYQPTRRPARMTRITRIKNKVVAQPPSAVFFALGSVTGSRWTISAAGTALPKRAFPALKANGSGWIASHQKVSTLVVAEALPGSA
jgi:hypothetical protein